MRKLKKMNKGWINIMEKNKTLKLTKENLLWHYSVVLFILIPPIFSIWRVMEYYIFKTYDGVIKPEFVTFEYVCLILAVFFFFLQTARLRFKKIKIVTDSKRFKIALDKTAEELDWTIDYHSGNFVRAHRDWNWSASWGEMVTIIRKDDHILINSICDPTAIRPSVSSWGWNRKNIGTFIKNLEKASA